MVDEPGKRSNLLNQLGDTYMHLKEYEKAIAAYERADLAKGEHRGPAVEEEISIPAVRVTEEVV